MYITVSNPCRVLRQAEPQQQGVRLCDRTCCAFYFVVLGLIYRSKSINAGLMYKRQIDAIRLRDWEDDVLQQCHVTTLLCVAPSAVSSHSRCIKCSRPKVKHVKGMQLGGVHKQHKQLSSKVCVVQKEIQERRTFLSELFIYHRDVLRPAGQKTQRLRALRNSHVKAFHRRYVLECTFMSDAANIHGSAMPPHAMRQPVIAKPARTKLVSSKAP